MIDICWRPLKLEMKLRVDVERRCQLGLGGLGLLPALLGGGSLAGHITVRSMCACKKAGNTTLYCAQPGTQAKDPNTTGGQSQLHAAHCCWDTLYLIHDVTGIYTMS